MSGMRPGLPIRPGRTCANALDAGYVGDVSHWTVENFVDYDETGFMVALVQFMHRITAYLLIIIGQGIIFAIGQAMFSPGMIEFTPCG